MLRLWFALFLAGTLSALPAVEPDITPAMNALQEGLNTHDASRFMPFIADDFHLEGIADGYLPRVLRSFAEQFPTTLDGYQICSVNGSGNRFVAQIRLIFPDRIRQERFLFNAQGQFVEMGLFSVQAMPSDEQLPQAESLPRHLVIPFICRDGLILTAGELNGQPGKWIVDSGAPRLIVNAKPTSGNVALGAQGINGAIDNLSICHIDSILWGDWSSSDFDAVSMDLSHLGEAIGDTLLGLIGFSVLHPYQIQIDYSTCLMELWLTDEMGNTLEKIRLPRPDDTIPFELRQHIPVITAKLHRQTLHLGLDTGAQANQLQLSKLAQVGDAFTKIGEDSLLGAGREAVTATYGTLNGLVMHKTRPGPMKTVVSDISALNEAYGVDLDGLLGYEFLRDRTIVINFRRAEIRIYEK
jgi:hypothetical protein